MGTYLGNNYFLTDEGTYNGTCHKCGDRIEFDSNLKGGEQILLMCDCGALMSFRIPAGVKGYAQQEKTRILREGIFSIFQEIGQVMGVRQVFYQAVSHSLVEKSEPGYGQIQRAMLMMRREGILPYSRVADATRGEDKPESFDNIKEALEDWLYYYKQNIWRDKDAHVEIWLEKRSLASAFRAVTYKYDVPLFASAGFASDSFIYEAAESMRKVGKASFVYFFSDFDPSGIKIAEAVGRGFERLADVKPTFMRVGLTAEQIDRYNVPTRPTKDSKHMAGFGDRESAELDALDPRILAGMVKECIFNHITQAEVDEVKREERRQLDSLLESDFYENFRHN